jgi:AcrR family transcriptional regulator
MSQETAKRAVHTSPPEETRGKLLKAAAYLFSVKGYEGATVRDICHRAGVNQALVNYHFGDKLGLWRAVIRYATDADAKLAVLQRALEQNQDPTDALRQIIRGALERLIATKELVGLQLRLMLREATNPTTVLSCEVAGTIKPMYDLFRSVVGKILDLPGDHAKTRLCTHSVMGQIAHYVHARPVMSLLWPELQMSPEQIDMVAVHIADFSLAYLVKPMNTAPLTRRRKSQGKRK